MADVGLLPATVTPAADRHVGEVAVADVRLLPATVTPAAGRHVGEVAARALGLATATAVADDRVGGVGRG